MKQIIVKSQKRFALLSIVIVIILAVVLGSMFYPNPRRGYTGKMESITIGTLPHELSALVYIAEDQKYFEANGLNVTVKNYDTGVATTDAVLKGEVDVAGAADFIIVGRSFKNEKIRSIATIAKANEEYVIGRTDRGISNISDLKGKRIGVPRQTVAEFFLGRFLDLHGMNIRQVNLVDVKPADSADAIANRDIDAIIAWQPYANQIEKKMPDKIVVWPAQGNQLLYWNLVATDAWVENHPELVTRILKSLAQSEDYVVNHPAEAKAIVQKRLNYDDSYITSIWPEHQYSLSLDQSLVLAMEDEARWMMNNNLTSEKKTPNFLDYIYEDGLKAVKPEAVNIIR